MPADAAPAVLLLHGQPGSAADWRAVIARLDGAVRPIAIDRPGWDRTTPPRDLAGNAQAALAALDGHGVQRALVAGHSLGAAVAAWLAARHPERVSALVLAAPAANVASLYRIDRRAGRAAGRRIGRRRDAGRPGAGAGGAAAPADRPCRG